MFEGIKLFLRLLFSILPIEYGGINTLVQQLDSPRHASWAIEIPRFAYVDRPKCGSPGHSLRLVARQGHNCWHVRVVVDYELIHASTCAERRTAVIQLCNAIDFGSLSLLNDTVTEVYVYSKQHTTATAAAGRSTILLNYTTLPKGTQFNLNNRAVFTDTCEDPLRYRYSPCDATMTTARLIEWDDVVVIDMLADGVSVARVASRDRAEAGGQTYVLKTVERLFYIPQDSEALQQELHVLERVGGQGNIIRLIAAVVSDNPYNTRTGKATSRVLRGILLEYHPNGSLAAALGEKDGDVGDSSAGEAASLPWALWASQLCTAVATLHKQNITHMDIKPSNMVVDKHGNLVLIDVGGAGGVTYEWLSPMMSQVQYPLAASFEDRKHNDIWAVGKVLSEMVDASSSGNDMRHQIEVVAKAAMRSPSLVSLELSASLFTKTCETIEN